VVHHQGSAVNDPIGPIGPISPIGPIGKTATYIE
jgi:hypothetical protein